MGNKMTNKFFLCAAACVVSVFGAVAQANPVFTATTSVSLDEELLLSVTDFTGIAGVDTSAAYPGFDFGFAITGDTTFDTDTLMGEIAHTGGVKLTSDIGGGGSISVTLGDFDIAYDAARATGGASGFFVADNIFTDGSPVFDIAATPTIDVMPLDPVLSKLTISDAHLLVSEELAALLFGADLLSGALTAEDVAGVRVGSARVDAFLIPEPGTLTLGVMGMLAIAAGRTRRRRA